jgi:hypothetical protein
MVGERLPGRGAPPVSKLLFFVKMRSKKKPLSVSFTPKQRADARVLDYSLFYCKTNKLMHLSTVLPLLCCGLDWRASSDDLGDHDDD